MTTDITETQARQVATILTEECGWKIFDQRDLDAFVYHVCERDCREYRFQGDLGFGGKFRNNGNNNNIPHVDCYPEDETPSRRKMIERANGRLRELFAALATPHTGKES